MINNYNIFRETANVLNDNDSDQYMHVNVARQLALVDWNLLDYVQNKISCSNLNGDIIDALVVASNHFNEINNKNKIFKDKRIIIFTDFSSNSEENDEENSSIESILRNLKKNEIRIDVISPFSEIEDENDHNSSSTNNGATTSKQQNGNNSHETETKQMTKQQKEIQKLVRKACLATNGSLYSFHEALKVLSIYQSKSIKSAGTKYTLTIGNSFHLPILSLIKCKENKPDIFKFKKVYAKDTTVQLKTDRTRFTKDDEKRNLDDKTETIDAYRYGSTNVPIDDADSVRLKVEKCFSLLGFTRSEKVKRHYFLSDSVNQIMPDSTHGGTEVDEAFINMVKSMLYENVYGIVRRVFSSRSSPELGCLIPYECLDGVFLYYLALPFDDDVRKFKLDNFKSKHEPTTSQAKLIDDLIDSMDLTSHGDDDEELYDPHQVFSPYIQRMFESIALRATKPDADLPDFDHNLTNTHIAEIEQQVKTERTLNLLKRCNQEFPTKVLTNKKLKSQDESLFVDKQAATATDETPANKEINPDLGLDEMLNSNVTNKLKRIGTIQPSNDFRLLAERLLANKEYNDEFEDLCLQIQTVIKDMFSESLDDTKLQLKIADCIRIQREYCVKLNMHDLFNSYLKTFKLFLLNANKKDLNKIESFWMKHLSKEQTSLITNLECADSTVSENESMIFLNNFRNDLDNVIETKKEETENVDDLLDMM
jgi:hypothetical protein